MFCRRNEIFFPDAQWESNLLYPFIAVGSRSGYLGHQLVWPLPQYQRRLKFTHCTKRINVYNISVEFVYHPYIICFKTLTRFTLRNIYVFKLLFQLTSKKNGEDIKTITAIFSDRYAFPNDRFSFSDIDNWRDNFELTQSCLFSLTDRKIINYFVLRNFCNPLNGRNEMRQFKNNLNPFCTIETKEQQIMIAPRALNRPRLERKLVFGP